jgi:hypothetical protein
MHTNFAAETKLKIGGGNAVPFLSWLGLLSEGRLCALWVEHRAQHIQRANLTQSADFWA